jgi:putative transposase
VAAGISRSSFHYESRRTDAVELLERIKEFRDKKPRWGHKRVHAKLRKEGFLVHHKRVERIWQEHGFSLPARRRRKKVRTGETVPCAAYAPNHVWTYDFVFEATHQGRRMEVLSVVDEFTREALAIVPARSPPRRSKECWPGSLPAGEDRRSFAAIAVPSSSSSN